MNHGLTMANTGGHIFWTVWILTKWTKHERIWLMNKIAPTMSSVMWSLLCWDQLLLKYIWGYVIGLLVTFFFMVQIMNRWSHGGVPHIPLITSVWEALMGFGLNRRSFPHSADLVILHTESLSRLSETPYWSLPINQNLSWSKWESPYILQKIPKLF